MVKNGSKLSPQKTINTNFNNLTRPVKLNGKTPIQQSQSNTQGRNKSWSKQAIFKNAKNFKNISDCKLMFRRRTDLAKAQYEKKIVLLRN